MTDLARQLIRENQQTQNTFLDLGNCGLTDLPPELLNCSWLQRLNLGYYYWDEEQKSYVPS